jgi:hypothetical protein
MVRYCETGMQVQSVLFDANLWTRSEARAWLLEHGFRAPAAKKTRNYYHYRQISPRAFVTGSTRTIKFKGVEGVKALVACP